MKKFSDIKLKGIKVNYDQNEKPLSITISIPTNSKDKSKNVIQAKETLTPDGDVTKQFIQSCVDKRNDFIHDWSEWKVKKIGSFDFKKHFWNSKNRDKYLSDGGDQLTIEDRARSYIAKIKENAEKTKKTIIGDESLMALIIRDFGHLTISELTLKHFQDMTDNANLKAKTISHRKSFLNKLIHTAMTDGVIVHNIFTGWTPEQTARNRKKKKAEAYNKEEFNLILEAAQKIPHFYPLFLFRCTTGMRPAEIYGLKWKFINLLDQYIEVKETLNERDWSFTDTPKTESGERLIAFNEYSLSAINAQRKLTDYNDKEALVFQNETSSNKLKAWSGSVFITQYDKVIKAAGVKRLDPYQLRHTFASILWNNKQISIEDLQVLLGHADIKTTIENYVVKDKPVVGVKSDGITNILNPALLLN